MKDFRTIPTKQYTLCFTLYGRLTPSNQLRNKDILVCPFTYLLKFSFWFTLSIAEQGFGIITMLLCAFKILESLHNAHLCQLFLRLSKGKYSAMVQFEQTCMPTALLRRFLKGFTSNKIHTLFTFATL